VLPVDFHTNKGIRDLLVITNISCLMVQRNFDLLIDEVLKDHSNQWERNLILFYLNERLIDRMRRQKKNHKNKMENKCKESLAIGLQVKKKIPQERDKIPGLFRTIE
jgi:hypothetical protein